MPIDITSVPQLARNLNRVSEIVGILAKYGLAEWLDRLDRRFLRRLIKDTSLQHASEVSHEARVRLAFTELGTTFIKLGQMLSTRRDLIGPALANELTRLQSNVPPDPFEVVRETVERELGKPLSELFLSFEPKALASASIGQAHKATLLDGREVVVKVQHPDLGPTIEADVSILTSLAELAEEYLSDVKLYRPSAVVQEFHKMLRRELDFLRECRHLQIFRKNFVSDPFIRIPAPILTHSTSRVLTMEYLKGTSLNKVNESITQTPPEELAKHGARIFLDMIFRDGFYHADPHPGNILIMPEGVIGVLDGGMVGRVDEKLRKQIETGMMAIMANDAVTLTDLIIQVGEVPPHFDAVGLQSEVADQLAFYWGLSLDQFNLAAAMDELTEAIRRYHVLLPPAASMLMKTLIMLEGSARILSPNFNLVEVLEPYRKQFVRRRFSPTRLVRRLIVTAQDWDEVFSNMPKLVRDLMQFARRQHFAVQLQHQHLDPSVNRLVFGMMTSALFVGSAMLWSMKAPPLLWDTPLFGVLGCLTSCVLGYRLFRAIQHSGKLEEDDR
jgi:ubiquinone biosynthesis protein